MEIECIGEISDKGKIIIDPSLVSDLEIGSTVRLKISIPADIKYNNELFIEMLKAAEQDWSEWGNSEEDIYEEYGQYHTKR